jgi:ribonuclease VapC
LIVVDTSALLAILLMEPEAGRFAEAVVVAEPVLLSAASFLEASILVQSRRGLSLRANLDRLVEECGIEIVPVTRAQALLARDAYARFGLGNHPAGLNFGDCFAYALARERDLPLLFKGNDFARTDLRSAL